MAKWSGGGDGWRWLSRRLPRVGVRHWSARRGRRSSGAERHGVQPDLHWLREPRADGIRVALRLLDRVGERLCKSRLMRLSQASQDGRDLGEKSGLTRDRTEGGRLLTSGDSFLLAQRCATFRGMKRSRKKARWTISPRTKPTKSSARSYGRMSGLMTLSNSCCEPCVSSLCQHYFTSSMESVNSPVHARRGSGGERRP